MDTINKYSLDYRGGEWLLTPHYTTITTSTTKVCPMKGYYHTISFLCFKRRFVACELCGQEHNDTGWKLFL